MIEFTPREREKMEFFAELVAAKVVKWFATWFALIMAVAAVAVIICKII